MTGAQMPSSGRLLEGTIIAVGCAVVLVAHAIRAAATAPARIARWARTRRTFADWITEELDRAHVGEVSGPGDDE